MPFLTTFPVTVVIAGVFPIHCVGSTFLFQEQPRPVKKLRLVRKASSSNSTILYVGLLERQKTSNEALQVLLRISDSLQFQVCTLH